MHAPNNSKIISLTKIFQLEVGQKSGYEKCAKNDFFWGGGFYLKHTKESTITIPKMYHSSKSRNLKLVKNRRNWNTGKWPKSSFFEGGGQNFENILMAQSYWSQKCIIHQNHTKRNGPKIGETEIGKMAKNAFFRGGTNNFETRSWGTLLGRFMPNFVRLAQL